MESYLHCCNNISGILSLERLSLIVNLILKLCLRQ